MHGLDPALPASLRTVDPAALEEADRYLMWGLLVDAAEALIGVDNPWGDDEGVVSEIRAWVVADDPAWPFSFVNACATVGVDVVQLRSELGAWIQLAPRDTPE